MSFNKMTSKQRKAALRAKERKSASANAPVTRKEFVEFLSGIDETRRELQEARTAISVLTMILEQHKIVTRAELGAMLDELQVNDIENTLKKLRAAGLTKDALVKFLRSNRIDPNDFRDVLEL